MSKVKEFPVNYGASIVGITTVETLAGGPPSTDLSYALETARSAVTFAVPLDEEDSQLSGQDRSCGGINRITQGRNRKSCHWLVDHLHRRTASC